MILSELYCVCNTVLVKLLVFWAIFIVKDCYMALLLIMSLFLTLSVFISENHSKFLHYVVLKDHCLPPHIPAFSCRVQLHISAEVEM